MPEINRQTKKAKRPEDRPIDSSGYFGLCVYNIPQGTLMVLIPGLTMMITGIILLFLPGHPEHTLYLGLMVAILGAVLTGCALIYWIILWLRYRPTKKAKVSSSHVQLTGIRVYTINNSELPPYPHLHNAPHVTQTDQNGGLSVPVNS